MTRFGLRHSQQHLATVLRYCWRPQGSKAALFKLTKTGTGFELDLLFTMSTKRWSNPTQPNVTPTRNTALKGSKIKINFKPIQQEVKIGRKKKRLFHDKTSSA